MLAEAAVIIFSLSPRMGISPFQTRATIRIMELREDMYCPSVEIQWGGGAVSKHEADCPPWEELTEEEKSEIYVYSRPSPVRYFCGIDGGCEHEIKVILRQGKRTVVLRETIHVH